MDTPFSVEEIARLRTLLGGSDSPEHYHSSDRNPTHDTVTQLEVQRRVRNISADYTATYSDDYIFVDTTAGNVNLTFPLAKGGTRYTVVMTAGAHSVVVKRTGADTVNGAASVTISSTYTPSSFKSVKGTGYVQV